MASRNRNQKLNLKGAIWLLVGSFCLTISSCVSVEAYQKMYLNDSEMVLKSRQIDVYGKTITTYREGASGADGGKTGGGCGCN